ncbi:hypothetical protein P186_0951 [Pyrobaculum ferrireducens]|uniref:Uncharacterized protein n=1 Tax=Pyrobaculum ferrireducens TaxID=1104324 RepID=G7VBG2_9CREN|nr:hypothetical protein P186_0951 [Pyrobaculum ferrireducens]
MSATTSAQTCGCTYLKKRIESSTRRMICDARYYSSLSQQRHGGELYELLLEHR